MNLITRSASFGGRLVVFSLLFSLFLATWPYGYEFLCGTPYATDTFYETWVATASHLASGLSIATRFTLETTWGWRGVDRTMAGS